MFINEIREIKLTQQYPS